MFDNFCLREVDNSKQKVAGYLWHVDDPDHVVCVVHGIGEYAGRYDRVATAMNENNIAVVGMDLRGHGMTYGKRGHCAPRKSVLEDIDALIAYAIEKYPGKPIILYGHSMGGNITMDYRKRGNDNNKVDAFVISSPWVYLVRPIPKALQTVVKGLVKVIPEMTISSGVSEKELGNKKHVDGYEKNPLVHRSISLECALDGFTTGNLMAEGKMEDNGGAVGKPMLLMHGTKDLICDVNGSRKVAAVETCEYIEWPGLFHEIHNGGEESTGDEVIEKMIQWIKAI